MKRETDAVDKHKLLQNKLLSSLIRKLKCKYVLGYDVSVCQGSRMRIPDVSVWEKFIEDDEQSCYSNLLTTIEITYTPFNERMAHASIAAIFEMSSSVRESFIYNYITQQWTRYSRTDKGIEKEDGKDYSSVLKSYLHTLLVS